MRNFRVVQLDAASVHAQNLVGHATKTEVSKYVEMLDTVFVVLTGSRLRSAAFSSIDAQAEADAAALFASRSDTGALACHAAFRGAGRLPVADACPCPLSTRRRIRG